MLHLAPAALREMTARRRLVAGPGLDAAIIEQDVARVNHSMSAEALTVVGSDLECTALARAVKWHAEHRVLLNGSKTVVFS